MQSTKINFLYRYDLITIDLSSDPCERIIESTI